MSPEAPSNVASALDRRLLAGALALVALYLAPLVVMGEDAYVLIHDNLDSNVLWYRILADSGLIFAPNEAIIPNLLGGVPRSAFGSEWNLQLWLYVVLPPFAAYVVNQSAMRLAAFAGMLLLLRGHVLRDEDRTMPALAIGCALCFALLPFWPSGGLSIAGQPLALYALLNIRRGGARAGDWAIVALLPFYSYLVVASFFFMLVLCVFAVGDSIRAGRPNARFLAALVLHGVLLLAVDYRLILSALSGEAFVSHRSEFVPVLTAGSEAWAAFGRLLLDGQYHAASRHFPVIASAALAACVLSFRRRESLRPLAACLLGVLGIAAYYGLYRWQGFAAVRSLLSLGVGFNADRFYTLLPMLTVVTFALALQVISSRLGHGRSFAHAFMALQVVVLFLHSDFVEERFDHGISFRAFFAREQFAAIEQEIGLPLASYRVASVGLHPSIAQYNGFHTVDGYFPNFPLRHKHALRSVMRHELAKAPALARYYDEWGSRAYVFSSELGRNYLGRSSRATVFRDLELDPHALMELDVRFVFAAAEIAFPERSGLIPRGVFEHPESAWSVYLYELSAPSGSSVSRLSAAPTGIRSRNRSGSLRAKDPAASSRDQ